MPLPWPKPNQRAIFIGPTSSGKTVLARTLLAHYRNVIVVDPKRTFSWKLDHPRYSRSASTLDELRDRMTENETTGDGAPILYRPPAPHLVPSNASALDEVARMAMESGGWLLYYDELNYVATGSNFADRAPNWYYAVTTGRERGVGVWSAFQRPSWIPIAAMSESDYRFVFYLRTSADRDRAEELCGDVPWDALQARDHSFIWADDRITSRPTRLTL